MVKDVPAKQQRDKTDWSELFVMFHSDTSCQQEAFPPDREARGWFCVSLYLVLLLTCDSVRLWNSFLKAKCTLRRANKSD